MSNVIKGINVVSSLRNKLKEKEYINSKPTLAIIRVGARPSDIAYETSVMKQLTRLQISVKKITLEADCSQELFDQAFDEVNTSNDIDGILLLHPVPEHLDLSHIEQTIDPEKDVDCIGNQNVLSLYLNKDSTFIPCTAEAVLEILDYQKVDLRGKDVVIVGYGLVIGRPLSLLMVERGATVTICHIDTVDLASKCREADIIVSATGVAKLIKKEFVKENAIVIDVGINLDEHGKICGDVDFDDVAELTQSITPVPGGVGTVTTHMLATHVIRAYEQKLENKDRILCKIDIEKKSYH